MATEQSVHPLTASQMLEQARRTVPEITASQARDRLERGEMDLLLDVRETTVMARSQSPVRRSTMVRQARQRWAAVGAWLAWQNAAA